MAEILALFDQWGETDRSHRKLAHRGSYLGRVWVSPSTVRRVLHERDCTFAPRPRPGSSKPKPFPDWVDYQPNNIWIYDTTHFPAAGMAVLIIEDLVSRKWITEVVSAEETSTQVELAFTQALETEGLADEVAHRADGLVDLDTDDEARPILLAVSDNGAPNDTPLDPGVHGPVRDRPALRPAGHAHRSGLDRKPQRHLKTEYPHLLAIRDPATLRAELADVMRPHYNGVRLHEGIGYVTPNDEHQGRGEAIRKARQAGLEQSRQRRLAWHRQTRHTQPN